MTIRDTKAEQGGMTEADWKQINDLLQVANTPAR